MSGVLALDLSLTATGWVFVPDNWYATDEDQRLVSNPTTLAHGEIKTPARGTRDDWEWSRDRFSMFSKAMLTLLSAMRPSVMAIEISSVVFGSKLAKGRYGAGAQYRAGQGLGRALGWIDGTMALASAYGVAPGTILQVSTSDAKLSVAGSRTADKATVRAKIEEGQPWSLKTWSEAEVDALAILLAHLKTTPPLGNSRRRETTSQVEKPITRTNGGKRPDGKPSTRGATKTAPTRNIAAANAS